MEIQLGRGWKKNELTKAKEQNTPLTIGIQILLRKFEKKLLNNL